MFKSFLICGAMAFGACVTAAGTAAAADMGPLFGQPENADIDPPPQYTFGTGWYLRGDLGYGETPQIQIGTDFPKIDAKHNFDGDIGAGYRFNQWFRSDLTFDLHDGRHINATGAQVICPYQLHGLTTQGADPVLLGYDWSSETGTCNGKARGFEDQAEVMVNGYIDLGTWYGLTPYIGAGVGAARIKSSSDLNYYRTSDGGVYDADLTPLGGFPLQWVGTNGVALNPQPTIPGTTTPVAFAKQNWSQSVHRTHYNFAWALMGGVSYAVDNHLSIDVGYRYLNAGPYKILPGQNDGSKTLTTQEVRLGLRYAID